MRLPEAKPYYYQVGIPHAFYTGVRYKARQKGSENKMVSLFPFGGLLVFAVLVAVIL